MNLNESLKMKYTTQYQKQLMEKWSGNIKAVRKVYPKFSDISAINLAILCENTDAEYKKYQRINEGTQVSDVGPYVRHAFEIITAIMPNLVAEEVVSVQALNQKIGQIFFLKYVFGSNKGTVKKGDTAFDPYNVSSHPEYTSEEVSQEVLSANLTTTTLSVSLAWGPVTPGTVVITAGTVVGEDDGHGLITGTGITSGTIDYDSGAVAITYSSAPNTQVDATYSYNLEYAPTQAPQFDMNVEERIVVAKPRRLRTNYAFGAAYDVEKQFGIDMDNELLTASVTEIKHEIDQEILGDLYRQAGLSHTWNMTVPNTISRIQHYESFGIAINEAENAIRKATKRVKGNFVILGINGLNVVESLPSFIPNAVEDKVGAYVAGTLKGHTKVIANPFYGDDQYLVGYKGNSFLDAGYVYAPYLPVFATQVVMLDDFVGRRGLATSYAKIMLTPNFYVKGTITHNPAEVAVTVSSSTTDPMNVLITNDSTSPVPTQEVTP